MGLSPVTPGERGAVATAAGHLLLPLLQGAAGERLRRRFQALRGARLVLLPLLPLVAASVLLWPHFPPTRDLLHDGWLHAVYFTLFLYGWAIGVGAGWWAEVMRLRWQLLTAALAALCLHLLLRAALGPGLVPRLVADIYVWTTLLAVLGWAHRLLNRPWRWLPWANASVYPWYMLHQTLIIVLLFWLAPLRLGPFVEPALLVGGTVAGCWGLTAVIRRVRWLRPLFGLKPPAQPRYLSPASLARRPGSSA